MRIAYRYITQSMPEADYVAALTNFKTVCANNKVALGLSTDQLAEITAAAVDAATKFNDWTAAQTAANKAKDAKNEQFDATATTISAFAKTFRANNAISDALLAELMVAPHNPGRTSSPPVTPTYFQGSADANGLVTLTWKRNGNTTSTQFVVEGRTSDTAPWTTYGVATSCKFTYQASPGNYVAFRVVAKKKNVVAPATTSVSFWGASSSLTLSEAA